MKERNSPRLGAYHVRAFSLPADQGGWMACGQTWMTKSGRPPVLVAQVNAGPHESEQSVVDLAYDQAYTDTLRLILREFACF